VYPGAVTDSSPEERVWTVPNVLSGLRLLGVAPLVWMAWRGDRTLFVALLVFLLFTDWLDGKLAVALDQRTELGPRLDSVADVLMYSAVALAFWWLEPGVLTGQIGWLVAALGSWLLSAGVTVTRFGKLPSYHTRAAKIGWLMAGGVALYTIWSGDGRPVPWALAWVTLTNVEAVAIGLLLPAWRADVSSLVEALRMSGSAGSGDGSADEGAPEEQSP